MCVVVIATKGQINAAQEGKSLVNDHDLLVMCPEVYACLDVLRMAVYLQQGRREGQGEGGGRGGEREEGGGRREREGGGRREG